MLQQKKNYTALKMTFFMLTIFWLHHAVQNDDQLAQNCRRRWGPRLLQRWCVTRVAHTVAM